MYKLRELITYLSDRRVPWRRKIWFYVFLLYMLAPIDFLPDIIPGLGWLDDLVILILGWAWLSRELGRYRGGGGGSGGAGDGRIIDVEYTVEPEAADSKAANNQDLRCFRF